MRRALIALSFALLFAGAALAVASNEQAATDFVFRSEGGYTNDPRDPGGPTNWGITIYDVRRFLKPDATAADVKALRKPQAATIYDGKYWRHPCIAGDLLPKGLDYSVMDFGVHSGVKRSGDTLRRLLKIDGGSCAISPDVVAEIAHTNIVWLIGAFNDMRLAFLKGLHTWETYRRGWSTRVAFVRAQSLRDAGSPRALFGPPPRLNRSYGKAIEGPDDLDESLAGYPETETPIP